MATVKKVAVKSTQVKREGVVKQLAKPKTNDITFDVKFDEEDEHARVSIVRNYKEIAAISFNVNGMEASCGMRDIDGVANIESAISKLKRMTGFNVSSVITEAVKILVKHIKDEDMCAFLVFSSNTHTHNANEILDDICISCTDYRENPNTGSQIRSWFV